MRRLTDELRSKGAESVVITSVVESETNQHMVCGYDKAENKYFEIPYDYISVRFPRNRRYFFGDFDRQHFERHGAGRRNGSFLLSGCGYD